MSRKMKEILEVIKEVQKSFRSCPDASIHSIHKLRIAAVKKVAKEEVIRTNTVDDKFWRKLGINMSEVDRLLYEWLCNGTKELENTLRDHYYWPLGRELDDKELDDLVLITEVFPRSSQVDQSPLEENRANIILREDEHEFKQIKDNLIEDDPPLESEKREVIVEMIDRDHRIIEDVKRIYDNRCQICGFTFKEKNGEFYSEGHHLIPLSEGGTQERDNIVILCPNHHRMIHYADVEIDDLKHEKREVKINGDTHVIVY